MRSWCISINGLGEVLSICDPNDVDRIMPSTEEEQETHPPYQFGRMFVDTTGNCVQESLRTPWGDTDFLSTIEHPSWRARRNKRRTGYHFITYAVDELGAWSNLQKWLEKHKWESSNETLLGATRRELAGDGCGGQGQPAS